MSGIQHQYTLNAVTALAFYQPAPSTPLAPPGTIGTPSVPLQPLLVLAGEGSFLKVFDAATAACVARCRVFEAQTVHGVEVLAGPVSGVGEDSDGGAGRGGGGGGSGSGIRAVVWGGKSFVLLGAELLEALVRGAVESITSEERVAPDWILDGAISPFAGASGGGGGGEECVFVTAHSVVLRAVREEGSGRMSLKALPTLSRSVLYSAHVVWTSPGSIMVAGGTVFGEVEVSVWQQVSVDALVSGRHMHTFTGHEGSVFGVRISPEIIDRDGDSTRYLASCSDDRTIRIWDISVSVAYQDSSELELKSCATVRETGFHENYDSPLSHVSAKRCIAVRMAHASRIWRVDFVAWKRSSSELATKVHVLSYGEDSTCQQWTLEFLKSSSELKDRVREDLLLPNKDSVSTLPAVLTHLKTFSYHSGKHIWSTALSFVCETSRRLVTGGADGKVAIYDIFMEESGETESIEQTKSHEQRERISKEQTSNAVSRSWNLEDVLNRSLMNGSSGGAPEYIETDDTFDVKRTEPSLVAKDVPNRYGFVGERDILITTSLGRVLYASISGTCKWEELQLSEKVRNDLRSYSLLLGIPGLGLALLAGANGTIYMYHQKMVTELINVSGKPAALLNVSKSSDKPLDILITTLGSGMAHLLSITTSVAQDFVLVDNRLIKLPSNFIVTSASNIMSLLILGARNGSIALYDLKNSNEVLDVISPQESQNDDAITTIIAIPSKCSQEKRFHFLTTSRNGSYSIFSFLTTKRSEDVSKKISIKLVHQAFPPLGPMIEFAWFSGSDLMLYGFRNKSFVVWNETKHCETSSIECGGAHRSYAYIPNPEAGGAGLFAYTKASRIYIHSQAYPSHRILKPGGHGREIKAAARHNEFIATGAEDTAIRIWRIRKDGEEDRRVFVTVDGVAGNYGDTPLECCAVLEKHTTGIQHLHWCCTTDDYHSLFSAGGYEEFHVWAVSDISGFGVGVVCEATLIDLSEDRDLRIMGFDIEFIADRRPRRMEEGDSPRGKNAITLIYSDSTIKCYDYSRTFGFEKTAQGKYTSACLTQVVRLHENRGKQEFFAASTDGHLTIWECPRALKPFTPEILPVPANAPPVLATPEPKIILRFQLHQSSISALAIQPLTLLPQNGGLLVATAGDDNAFCLTFFHNLSLVKCILVPAAHAAGITGLAFRPDVTGGESEDRYVQLWSAGGDQRVKRWTVEFGLADTGDPKPIMENGLNMRLLGQDEGDDVWSSVADPGGLVEWRDDFDGDHVLVYGNGMEVFGLKDGFPNGVGTRWVGYIEEGPRRAWSEEGDDECVKRNRAGNWEVESENDDVAGDGDGIAKSKVVRKSNPMI